MIMDGFIALYIFILAAITAYEVISKAPANLHTPLISAACFINGIVLVGAIIVMGKAETNIEIIISFIAVMLATANAVGGYFISASMMSLFKKNNKNTGNL